MSEEKSNIEKLGEDLKGVASDVANSEAVKTVKEKLSEAAESEMAQKAKEKISEVANSEAAQKAKEKVFDAAKAAKEKLDELSEDERVKAAKAQAMGYIAKAKVWIVDNWHAGRNGKLKVAAAFVIAFLALRGLFCGWGSSASSQQIGSNTSGGSDAEGAAALALLMNVGGGSSSSSSSSPRLNTYSCECCGLTIQKETFPPSTKCPRRFPTRSNSDTGHKWHML